MRDSSSSHTVEAVIEEQVREKGDVSLEDPPSPTLKVAPPPDGGFHAWAQVVSGHLVLAMTWGYGSSFGVFQNYYDATLPQSPSQISWIGGVQVFSTLFISALSGRATDAGQARLVVGLGCLLLVFGTFMTSLATEYWQIFLAQGLCIGIGQGLMWIPTVALISTYFAKNRVFAVTTAATGTSTGGIIFPAMIQYLIPKIGFPWAVRCMGFVVLVMSIVTLALLRTRLPPRKSGPLIEWGAFREPAYMLFTLGIFLLYWTLYFGLFYIQVYATQKLHLSEAAGVILIIVTNACGIPIRPAMGFLADRRAGPLNCLIPWVLIYCVVMFSWIAVHSVAGFYAFAVFFGLSSAACMGLFAGSLPSLTKDLDKVGTRMGMVLTMISVGPLTGPSVAGALIERTGGDYTAAQIWAGVALFASTCCLVSARLIASGPNLRVKM